jgi:hypothetical protein
MQRWLQRHRMPIYRRCVIQQATDSGFGTALEQLMVGARLWDTSLARRLGVSRSEVFRWRTGRAVPASRNRSRLVDVFRRDGTSLNKLGASHALLLEALEEPWDPPMEGHPLERMDLAQSCMVFAYQYSRRSLPSQWSKRLIELEKVTEGTMESMLYRFSASHRPASVTRAYREWYDDDVVEAYVDSLAARHRLFEERVQQYTVRHLYSKTALLDFLRQRRFHGSQLDPAPVREQVELIVRDLDNHYPNFEIGLDEEPLPFHATIVGRQTVLLLMRDPNPTDATCWAILGMEIAGHDMVRTFSQAFERTWAKKSVVRDPALVKRWLLEQV